MIPTRTQEQVLSKMKKGWTLVFRQTLGQSRSWGELRPPEGQEGSPLAVTRLTAQRMEVKGLIQFDGFKGDDMYYGLPRV